METAVTIPLEQQINGAEGMKYIDFQQRQRRYQPDSATFDLTRNPDLAAVDIQNRVNRRWAVCPMR